MINVPTTVPKNRNKKPFKGKGNFTFKKISPLKLFLEIRKDFDNERKIFSYSTDKRSFNISLRDLDTNTYLDNGRSIENYNEQDG